MPAARRAFSSDLVSSRYSPGCSIPSFTAPMALRRRRITSSPTASHIRRISRFLPSRMVISSTVRSGSSVTTLITAGWVRVPSSSSTPWLRATTCSSVARGRTVTRYSLLTPWEGCIIRLAKSPSLVSRSRPSLSRSRRPTGNTRAGTPSIRSITVLRPSSSLVVVTNPRGLLSI